MFYAKQKVYNKFAVKIKSIILLNPKITYYHMKYNTFSYISQNLYGFDYCTST